MKREFSPYTREKVMGHVLPEKPALKNLIRTPLHVEFDNSRHIVSSQTLHGDHVPYGPQDPNSFNAVGSLNYTSKGAGNYHLPVINTDGGASVQQVNYGSKLIIRAAHEGTYAPDSLLKDLLGDYGIDLEVFSYPQLEHSVMMGETYYKGMRVDSLVLRSALRNVFDVAPSTQKNHNHLYIQQAFEKGDHEILISELGRLGIVSPRWQQITEAEGMGIVRTPWTDKEISHRPS
jgi:hypothetical protein